MNTASAPGKEHISSNDAAAVLNNCIIADSVDCWRVLFK